MRAAVLHHADFEIADLPEPTPAKGQVRVEVLRCGICGSDLHARHGCDAFADVAARGGYMKLMRSHERIVMGHEFCGGVAEHGPGCRKDVAEGTPVVALPLLRGAGGVHPTGLSAPAPGGYAEQLLVEESLMMAVPNGLAPDVAALTEPMAVAWHAVRRGEVAKKDVAIVIGCGPVGLGVVLMLKASGVRTVVAADLSPRRRALAMACGADVVVDPREQSPYRIRSKGHLMDGPAAFELVVGTTERLSKLPFGWWHAWRLAEKAGAGPRRPVIFECVGVPGLLESVIDGAPLLSRVVVVGVCVGEDRFTPALAINKELDLRFVLGYTPLEFRDALHMLAEGKVDPRPVLSGTVGLEGVDAAFAALADPEEHAKILVDPRSTAAAPEPVRKGR